MTQQAIPLTRTRTRWSSASTDDQFVVENPATGQTVTVVQGAGPVEVDLAVRKAHASHLRWKQRPARERGTYLRKIAEVIRAHAEVGYGAQHVSHQRGRGCRPASRPRWSSCHRH